jgi:hypothetical protein
MSTIYTRATKGSALTWTEGDDNITNLNNDKIEAVIEDTAPELGGDLDVGTHSIITSVTNGDITIAPDGLGSLVAQSDTLILGALTDPEAVITTDGATSLVLDTNNGTDSGSITITAGVNGDIEIAPNGTGSVVIDGLNYPQADGTAGQVIVTDGAGNLSFDDAGGGIADVVEDLTPQLGGNLDVNGNSIVSVSNNSIQITPNGTGQTVIKNLEYNEFVHSLGTTSGTITPNVANGNVQTITLNGNLTFSAFTSPVAGQSLTLIINTGGTSRTLTSTMKFAGGSKTLSVTNTTDIISVFYDGTNYWASLSKDFV